MELSCRADEYQACITQIEVQHTLIWELFCELYGAVAKGNMPLEEIHRIRDKMICAIIEHSSYEEELMESRGYPEFAAHKAEHDRLKTGALNMKQCIDYDREEAMRVCSYGMEQMWQHIRIADKAYMDFFSAQGAR